MNPKSYVRFYAFREMKSRPRTFLPLLAIFFGVILLVGNLLIWFQCELVSDVAYYRVKAQLILPDIREEEVPVLEALPWVNAVEAVPAGTGYTCYVDLTEDVVTRYDKVQNSLYSTIERMDLGDRSMEYVRFWTNIHNDEMRAKAYDMTKLINANYIQALRQSLFQPSTMMLAGMAMAMLFAVTVLVYRMKLAQSRAEYACLTGMGMTVRDLGRMQTMQGWLILTVTYIPASLLAMGTMWVVSEVSKGLYPAFDGNQALQYSIPWLTIGILYVLYLVAIWLGIQLCMVPFRKQSVSAMLKGDVDKIPFIEKSSGAFLSQGSFDGYGKLWKKRNRRNLVPVMVLFGCLILLPAFIFGGFMDGLEEIFDREQDGEQVVCTLSATGISLEGAYGVPYSVVQELATLPVVTEVSYGGMPQSPATGIASPVKGDLYYMHIEDKEAKVWLIAPLATDGTETVYAGLAPDEIIVGEDWLCEIGDTVTLQWNGRTETARIGGKIPGLKGFSPTYDQSRVMMQTAISIELFTALTGEDTVYLNSNAYVSADVTDETVEDVLDTIAIAMGDTKVYLNDYDRILHNTKEKGYIIHNAYYNNRIGNIQGAFLSLFFLTQAAYLMLCAAAVIGTTVGFQLRRRKNEFAILRALGLMEEKLHELGQSYAGVLFRYVVPVLYPVLVLLLWTSNPDAGIRTDDYGNTYIGALGALKTALWSYAVTCVLLFLLYSGTSWLASRGAVRDMVSVPLASAVKERE